MKKKLEAQTILILLCALVIAVAWIGIQVAKDSLGMWSESAELHFTTPDLLGLGPRAELRCAGATIGHVRKVTPSLDENGRAQFLLVSGVKKEYANWKFAPIGIVRAGVVESALSPSSILMELSVAPEAVLAQRRKDGPAPILPLEKERSENDIGEVVAQYRKLGDQLDLTIRQFTEAQNGRTLSVMAEFAEAIPAAANSLRQVEVITAKLEKEIGENGRIDQTLTLLNDSFGRLQGLTDIAATTLTNLNSQVDLSLGKVNGLLDETSGTMMSLHSKVDGFGNTLVGRVLIAKADAPKATPTPTPAPKKTR